MITKVKLKNFKRFSDTTINLKKNKVQVLAGQNNSGKSSILHSLAVWEYCKTLLYFERGADFFNDDRSTGINSDDFTPINLPSLKYLWTSLKPGSSSYNLEITVFWHIDEVEYYLGFVLAYAQERVYIKILTHNITSEIKIPKIAYIPPFAGIQSKETWHSPADRKKLIGQGLAGAVLRNSIIDLYADYIKTKNELLSKRSSNRLSVTDWRILKDTSAFEILNRTIFRVFGSYLFPTPFNPEFHTYLTVNLSKGTLPKNHFYPHTGYGRRDIMVEGSGFLQWLSVYVYALDKNIDILLLDEPDAHLHTSLQRELFNCLLEISSSNGRQVLFATHSPEIIKYILPEYLLLVEKGRAKFLSTEQSKTVLLSGLGSEHNLLFHKIQERKNILFVENSSDSKLLQSWCSTLGSIWPSNIYVWPFANGHQQRKQLFLHLKDHMDVLKCISLVDRDNGLYENTNISLEDSASYLEGDHKKMHYKKWRRWEIENYLICPASIARATQKTVTEIERYVMDEFSLSIPADASKRTERLPNTRMLFDTEGKAIIEPLCKTYHISKQSIANNMNPDEICEDVKTLLNQIIEMCNEQ